MSTHCHSMKSRILRALLICLALFVVSLAQLFLLPLSSTTLAAPRLASTPPKDEYLARAGVSLVRLLVNYSSPGGPTKSFLPCTGLGVLVGSWNTTDTAQFNTAILTDGNLFDTQNAANCVSGPPLARNIDSVQIFFSNLYSSFNISSFPLKKDAFSIKCLDERDCSHGPALLSFHDVVPLPFLQLAQNSNTLQGFKLALTNPQGVTAPANNVPSTELSNLVSSFVTPQGNPDTNPDFHPESGSPEVTPQGLLLSLHLADGQETLASGLSQFLQDAQILSHPDTDLQKNWRTGVIKYYETPNRSDAKQSFQLAAQENTQFQAPNDFVTSLSASNSNGNGGKTPVTTSASTSNPPRFFSDPLGWLVSPFNVGPATFPHWVLIIGALLLLLVLFALFSLLVTFYRRRREYKAANKIAERQAAIEAQRISAHEAKPAPVQPSQSAEWPQLPIVPAQLSPILPPHPSTIRTNTPPKSDLRCPRCHEFVPADANYCTNCSLMLSPTESGLHLRIAPKPIMLPSTSSPVPASPAALQSQPTQTSQLAAVRPSSIVDHPTIEMAPTVLNGSSGVTDQTLPLLQLQGRRLGFVVGTHSDPGIKRKFKPNEDSVFAAQGPRSSHPQQSQFGLFVVADGMGGHANGQDASRRAIQTIVDYMLPKLIHSGDASPAMLESLLQDGVQQANQAVHRNNMDLHADMGTTITATLVVDATAYVCNVGDSRTYLYREAEGLRKVTNDHSVVASLVEAGIIKPDDIYTHPKRNQIYRSLGEKLNVEVDSFRVSLQSGDKLLLCSDGLWDMVRDPQIEDLIKTPLPDPNQTASDLIRAALEGGGEDNVSVIVISVTESANYGLSTDLRLIAKPESVQMPPV